MQAVKAENCMISTFDGYFVLVINFFIKAPEKGLLPIRNLSVYSCLNMFILMFVRATEQKPYGPSCKRE